MRSAVQDERPRRYENRYGDRRGSSRSASTAANTAYTTRSSGASDASRRSRPPMRALRSATGRGSKLPSASARATSALVRRGSSSMRRSRSPS